MSLHTRVADRAGVVIVRDLRAGEDRPIQRKVSQVGAVWRSDVSDRIQVGKSR
jgi:hypothetical protein